MSQRPKDRGQKYYVAVKQELKLRLKKPKQKKGDALGKNLTEIP